MRRGFANMVLKLFGWRTVGAMPHIPKAVLVVAPHTSNWDFVVMLALAIALGVKTKWMGKHSLFRPPFGWLMRGLGGLPINRTARHNVVDQVIEAFRSHERLIVAILPEGTRKRTEYWKTGFYYIANGAHVPFILGFADYKRKVGGIGPVFMPSGDIEADMAVIRDFYTGIVGKYPEQFGEVRVKPTVDTV